LCSVQKDHLYPPNVISPLATDLENLAASSHLH
jgi:hypothetical protein